MRGRRRPRLQGLKLDLCDPPLQGKRAQVCSSGLLFVAAHLRGLCRARELFVTGGNVAVMESFCQLRTLAASVSRVSCL